MDIALWIAAILLAAFFLAAGISKTLIPLDKLADRGLGWAQEKPAYARTAGVAEILGALGLILPAVFTIATFLIPLAAAGLALIMALSIAFHLSRGEKDFAINIAALLLAVSVAWGRSSNWPL
ncbi:DoxX family protein [Arthrobacter sp. Br18]|uniref:DoxX family protein n=1 Tax=Arthrobacter sp. Br18 TaxID=1312954 RepID=UPI00047D7E10|nr:DoxX family protein [Arthrobacter sp. Br18]